MGVPLQRRNDQWSRGAHPADNQHQGKDHAAVQQVIDRCHQEYSGESETQFDVRQMDLPLISTSQGEPGSANDGQKLHDFQGEKAYNSIRAKCE
jgi:hypothetical protein